MENAIFTGDSYIPDLNVVTTFLRSNKEEAEISKQKILRFAEGKNIYPGHGTELTGYQRK
jgi:glyoxylase-like metal-dependent hydrolase (beta-lactamase superfamily II)